MLKRKIVSIQDLNGKIIQYIPARLTEGVEWYVSFWALDPYTGELRRKKIKVNRVKGQKEKRRFARQLIADINRRLAQGWNPWIEAIAPRGTTLFKEAVATFLKRKGAELRPDSMRSYTNQSERLLAWLKNEGKEGMQSAAFTVYLARDYMDHKLDEGVGNTTYNNVITFGKVLFNWLKEQHYCAENPFDSIKRLREAEKVRDLIPQEWRVKIREYLAVHNPGFLRCCMLQFYAEIRPTEQVKLQIRDVMLHAKVIAITPETAKTGTGRWSTIPNALIPYLRDIPWTKLRQKDYLIGENFQPGPVPLKDAREYTRVWQRMRKALKMPKQYQFYSLRDTGIVHMLSSGIPINEVMKQAGHASLETTTRYVKHLSPEAIQEIKRLKNGF